MRHVADIMDRRLVFVLQRAARAVLGRANTRAMDALDISVPQLGTLFYLQKHAGASMTDVADLLDLNKSAASGMLGRLQRAGLIRREANPQDARGMRIFLSAKGESKCKDARAVVRAVQAEVTQGMTASEVEIVLRFLNGIIERFRTEDAT